jgi:capsular polysaccharide biosynthesis protein
LVGFFVSQFVLSPEYTASTRIYVLNGSSETTVVYSDFQISSQMLNDYKVLITGQNVTKEVISRLDLDMKPSTRK